MTAMKPMRRPIKSCTHCRQQKIRCNAAQTYPEPCSRCAKYGRTCSVDPLFKPRRGGQVELLREDIRRLETRLAELQPHASQTPELRAKSENMDREQIQVPSEPLPTPDLPMAIDTEANRLAEERANARVVIVPTMGPYILEGITISQVEADTLHARFMSQYWPYLPIFESNCAAELYSQSETLFWAVMCSAALSELSPSLYLAIVEPLRRLVAHVTLLETPRSTHIVQALLILSTWPLPNEKVLDDAGHRYVSLARSLGLQLGMHRGQFIYEFSRKQKMMPNAIKWRTCTWLYTYICDQFLSSSLGLPSSPQVDYIIDQGFPDDYSHRRSSAHLKLTRFYSKMVTIMGSSLSTPDGLLDARSRGPTLDLLNHDLRELLEPRPNDSFIEIMGLHMQCILCCFAFLPDTPESDQSRYVLEVFKAATRLVTVMRHFVGTSRIFEFPTFVRQAASFAALLLFRLQLLPQLPTQYAESARESVVTVHHLYRNVSPAWAGVQNDVTRIAKILESLNYVLITHPQLLAGPHIMCRMRSHLTGSLFYELLWAVHEARRRNAKTKRSGDTTPGVPKPLQATGGPDVPPEVVVQTNRNLQPLPLFSHISTDAYKSSTTVSPNGTTMTKLEPNSTSARTLVTATIDVIPPGPIAEPDMGLDQLLQGFDWMEHEGDDFLGWLPNAEMGL